jgi:hypothetical protein
VPSSGTVKRYATSLEFKDDLVDGKLLTWIKRQLQAPPSSLHSQVTGKESSR